MNRSLLLALSIVLIVPYAAADFFDDTMHELGTAFDLISKTAHKTTKKMRERMDKMMRDDWTRIPDSPCSIAIEDAVVRITMKAPGINADDLKPTIESGIFQLAITTPDYQAHLDLSADQLHLKTTQEYRIAKKSDPEGAAQEGTEPQSVHSYRSTQSIARIIPTIDLDSISVEYEKEVITITARLIAPIKNKKVVPVTIKN